MKIKLNNQHRIMQMSKVNTDNTYLTNGANGARNSILTP